MGILQWIFGPHFFDVGAVLCIGIGVAMALSSDPKDISGALWFFSIAAILSAGRAAHWIVTEDSLPLPKPVLAVILFGGIGAFWILSYTWVQKKVAAPTIASPNHPPELPKPQPEQPQPNPLPKPKPEAKAHPIVIDRRLLLGKAESGKPLTLRLVFTNITGEPIAASYRFRAGIFPGKLQDIPSEKQEEGWRKLEEYPFQDQDFSSQGPLFFDITTSELDEPETALVNRGEHTPYFMYEMRQAQDKRVLLEVCIFLAPDGHLMLCQKHNWP